MLKTCEEGQTVEKCVLCEESYCTNLGKQRSLEENAVIELLREDDYHLLCPVCLSRVSKNLALPRENEPIVVVCVVDGAVHGVSQTNGQASMDSASCVILDDYDWHSDDPSERLRYLRTLAVYRSLSRKYIPDRRMEK